MKMVGFFFLSYLAFMYRIAHLKLMDVSLCSKTNNLSWLPFDPPRWVKYIFSPVPLHPPMLFFRNHGKPTCANDWFIVGMYVNIFTNYITGIGACLVLYSPEITPLPLNVILNSVAIGFIKGLDDDIVTPLDLAHAAKKIEKYKEKIRAGFFGDILEPTEETRIQNGRRSSYYRRPQKTTGDVVEAMKELSTGKSVIWDYAFWVCYICGLGISLFIYVSPLWFVICY